MTPRQAPTLEQELRELRTRVRELESRQTSVKRETTPLKRERSPEDIYGSTPKRGRSKLGAPVIDLTDE
ncbi:MAG: hypothetical protein M1815_005978 [Lichina confinis]|nr:MAG: hypothetical protein M1815_005978 [Lichina confinis]